MELEEVVYEMAFEIQRAIGLNLQSKHREAIRECIKVNLPMLLSAANTGKKLAKQQN